jgi:hypothetical protein
VVASEDEDEFSEDDDESWVKPMSSIELKRSMQGSLSVGSVASPKNF